MPQGGVVEGEPLRSAAPQIIDVAAATPPLDTELAVPSAPPLAAGHELHAPSENDLAREGPLSREQVADFYKNGVVLVRGLLQGDLLERMLAVRQSVGTNDTSSSRGLLGPTTPAADSWDLQVLRNDTSAVVGAPHEVLRKTYVLPKGWREHACFLDAALRSPLAAAAEQLTPDEVRGAGRGKPLRVLRDDFFSLSPGKRACGWRVDELVLRLAQRTLPRHVLGRLN